MNVTHCDADGEGLKEDDGHEDAVEVVDALAEVEMLGEADTGALAEATEGEGERVGP